jgi:hypothetical protein
VHKFAKVYRIRYTLHFALFWQARKATFFDALVNEGKKFCTWNNGIFHAPTLFLLERTENMNM